jgi:hypothetical protein
MSAAMAGRPAAGRTTVLERRTSSPVRPTKRIGAIQPSEADVGYAAVDVSGGHPSVLTLTGTKQSLSPTAVVLQCRYR